MCQQQPPLPRQEAGPPDAGDRVRQPDRDETKVAPRRASAPTDDAEAGDSAIDDPRDGRDRTPPPVASSPDGSSGLDGGESTCAAHGEPLPVIAGFQLLRKLGHGGMGIVYKARQLRPDRIVALKMILAGQYASAESRLRFHNEAELVARLHHPHIVQVFSVGEHAGHPYFVMEYMDGGTVARRLSRGRHYSAREAAELVETMARACHFAHERRIVHRDIKPGNVLLTRDGFPKLADFGLAKNLSGDLSLTGQSQILGTLEYMAPEQAWGRARDAGPAADVYSLGVMLYELLTGRRPFEADSDPQVLDKICNEETPSPAWLKPGLARDLETICLKCLRKEAARRYATAHDLAEDLRRFREGRPIVGRPPSAAERIKSELRYHPLRICVVFVAAVAVLLAGWAFWWLDAYHWEKTRYYASYVARWGAVDGLGPVSKAVQSRRAYTYKFVYRGRRGPLVRVEVVNQRGVPDNSNGGELMVPGIRDAVPRKVIECIWTFDYDDHGRILSETGHDARGQPIWQLRYEYDAEAEPVPHPRRLRGRFHDHRGNVAQTSGGTSSVTLEMDEGGYVVWLRFLDSGAAENPRMDDTGVYGHRYTYADGNVQSQTNVDAAGDPMPNRHGVVRQVFTLHPDFATAMTIEFVDADDRPLPVHTGYHRVVVDTDAFGNTTYVRYEDILRRPVQSDDNYAIARIRYGKNEREYEWYNARERLIARQRWILDDRTGRPTTREFLEYADANVVSRTWQEELTPDGSVAKRVTRGTNQVLMSTSSFRYDKLNRIERMDESDETGAVVEITAWQYQGSRPTRKTRRRRVDGDMRIVEDESYEYEDTFGRNTRTVRFAHDGAILGATQYHYRLDALFAHEQVDYGAGGTEFLRRALFVRDSRGNILEQTFVDAQGTPVPGPDGYSTMQRAYEGGLLSNVVFTGFSGDAPYVRHEQVFDPLIGQVHDESYRNATGELARGPDGYAQETTHYNDLGYWTEFEQAGYDGSMGYAIARHSRDLASHWKRIDYLDADGNPARHRFGNRTFTAFSDERGRVITQVYEGFDGLVPYDTLIERFDQSGRLARTQYRDAAEAPAPCSLGFSESVNRYDASGRLVAYDQFGYDSERLGFSRCHVTLDEQGLAIESRRFNADGNAAASTWMGYSVEKAEYDDRGRLVRSTYVDNRGMPARDRWGGFSEIRYEYSESGSDYRAVASGCDGSKGYASYTQHFDSNGRLVEVSCFRADGARANTIFGYSTITAEYSDAGDLLRLEHRDAEGTVVPGSFQVVFAAVVPCSQADLLGLRPGDALVSYNGVPGSSHLVLWNERTRVQEQLGTLDIEVLRDGRVLKHRIRPGSIGVYWEDRPAAPASGRPAAPGP